MLVFVHKICNYCYVYHIAVADEFNQKVKI